MLDQTQTHLLDALWACATEFQAPFYAPGHKRGQGISSRLSQRWGAAIFQADLPELPALDNLFAPAGVIQAAQNLAAEAFGAEVTRFLVNGSTAGIVAAILAVCDPGDQILLSRTVHKSAISGVILAGAIPIFLPPVIDPQWDFPLNVNPTDVAQALEDYPQIKAVMIVSPTYQGVCADLAKIAEITHEHHIPLLVDEAHGPHFTFHPDLPPSALTCGADLTIQSTHKVLGAMTQASMLHLQGERLNRPRLESGLQLVQSTSPSYLLLASLDAARHQIATQGKLLLERTIKLAKHAQNQLQKISNLLVFQPPELPKPGFFALDPTRLTLNISSLGLSGFQVDEELTQHWGVIAELPLPHSLTFLLTLGNTDNDIQQLIQAFTHLNLPQHPNSPPTLSSSLPCSLEPPALSPRAAYFAPSIPCPLKTATGKISAELICPYPPGIPILMPGERITPEALDYLQQVLLAGGVITGCSDPNLQTLRIIQP